jgi:chromosome segregation ATPase
VKKEFKLGYLDWILNKQRYINLYFEKQDRVQELLLQNSELEEQLTSATNSFLRQKEKSKATIENLQKQLTDKSNRVLVLDKTVVDRNKEIQELHYELSKVNLKLDKKIKAFNKIRGSIGGYQKELNKLREEFSLAKKKISFLKDKVPRKTLEEIKAYDYGRREILKRSKVNINEEKR